MWDAVAVCVRLWLWEAVGVGGFCGFGSSGLKKLVDKWIQKSRT